MVHISLNVAMTADGKIAPANRRFVPFGSKYDRELLLDIRARCDAVICGARTVDLYPVDLGPGPMRYRKLRRKRGLAEYNLRVVVSGSGSLDPTARIFRKRFSPIVILTSNCVTPARRRQLTKVATQVKSFGEKEVNLVEAMKWLENEWGVRRAVCEGGGELNDSFFRAELVDEVFVTLCPMIFGGGNAPTLADGRGFSKLADAAQLRVKSRRRLGDELYLVYRVLRRSSRTTSIS